MAQTQQLEAIRKRAIQIILNFSRGMPRMLRIRIRNPRSNIGEMSIRMRVGRLSGSTNSVQNQTNAAGKR